MLLLVSSMQAAAASFNLPTFTLTPGDGYGSDTGQNPEHGATLLGVRFTNVFAPKQFELSSAGEHISFDVATVRFYEPDIGNGNGNKGVRTDEQDQLDLTAAFGVVNPAVTAATLTATGVATHGALDDEDVDFSVTWNPLVVDFGNGGQYRISLNSLSFTDTNSEQTLRATVELLEAPGLRVSAVPEPGSFALVGVALAGAGFVRRKPRAAGQASKKQPV